MVESMDAVLKREYGVDVPGSLDEEEWLRLYAEYRLLRKTELEEIEIAMQNAMAKVITCLFSKSNGINSDSMDTGTGG